ncbi:unnamed protein product [Didymodactylos carnosus]|uniref:Uncharacterized protein n=1 Tax=Didymodactylos carnosus TaxID=1234261 RepID=A0A815RVF0_9BILA|nr:unnamed protein product [Didymodactylos carnosus]CAF1482077.1 unnamed protein product [Didymodactylos carnosus]CAF4085512.1 unnamed protein product [Didymodactylos carnosus]CAF4346905.1 unnamed protein product [Didymodactylos carnosus]
MASNCPVKIRLYNTCAVLKITTLTLNHNHKTEPSNLKYYPRNRRLHNNTTEMIKVYDRHKVSRSIIVTFEED